VRFVNARDFRGKNPESALLDNLKILKSALRGKEILMKTKKNTASSYPICSTSQKR